MSFRPAGTPRRYDPAPQQSFGLDRDTAPAGRGAAATSGLAPSPAATRGRSAAAVASAPAGPAPQFASYPFNLGITDSRMALSGADAEWPGDASDGAHLFATPGSASAASAFAPATSMDLSKERLLQLQLDCGDYVDNLDHVLRTLFTRPNARLVRRLREFQGVPLTFLHFRNQQALMKLTGDLSTAREREMLNRLASLLDA